MPREWQLFWQCQRSPVLRSQVVAALLAGTVIEVERLPRALLADVAVLATVTRTCCDAEIVDDYQALLQRVEEVWQEPTWTCRTFDSPYLGWLHFVLLGSVNLEVPEVAWMPDWIEELLEQDMPGYLAPEKKKERKRAA